MDENTIKQDLTITKAHASAYFWKPLAAGVVACGVAKVLGFNGGIASTLFSGAAYQITAAINDTRFKNAYHRLCSLSISQFDMNFVKIKTTEHTFNMCFANVLPIAGVSMITPYGIENIKNAIIAHSSPLPLNSDPLIAGFGLISIMAGGLGIRFIGHSLKNYTRENLNPLPPFPHPPSTSAKTSPIRIRIHGREFKNAEYL